MVLLTAIRPRAEQSGHNGTVRHLVWIALVVPVACTAPQDESSGPEPAAESISLLPTAGPEADCAESGPVLVRLQTREGTITVHGRSPRDPELRFSVADPDGALLEGGLTRDKLRQRYPEFAAAYDSAFADSSLDASLGTHHVGRPDGTRAHDPGLGRYDALDRGLNGGPADQTPGHPHRPGR